MFRRIALGCVVGMLSATPLFAQQPARRPRSRRAAQQPAAQPNPFVFPGDGGVILNFVKADKTADFEMVLGKVKEALAKSEKPERKQQATGWKVFKASEPGPNGAVIYVFVHRSGGRRAPTTRSAASWSKASAPTGRRSTRPTPIRSAPPRSAPCCT